MRRIWRHPKIVLGGVLLSALVLLSLAAPWIAPYDPIELDVVQDADTGPAAVLRIENDGVHPADSGGGATGGSGLVGLRARLADLGGDLDAEALSGSRFVVQVRLPLTRRSTVAATAAEPMP